MTKFNRQSIRLQNYNYSRKGFYFITIQTEDSEHKFGKIENVKMYLNQIGHIAYEEWYKLEDRFNIKLHEFVVMPNHVHGIIELLEYDEVDNKGSGYNTSVMGGDYKGVINYAPTESPQRDVENHFSKISPKSNSLPVIVRSYKSCVTRTVRQTKCRGVIYNALTTKPNALTTKPNPQISDKDDLNTKYQNNVPIKSNIKQTKTTIWERNYYERIIRNEKELNNIRKYIIDNPKNWELEKPRNELFI